MMSPALPTTVSDGSVVMVSRPEFPTRRSPPLPPVIVSLPEPPKMVSLELPPDSTSLPPFPLMIELPAAPVKVSLRAPPSSVTEPEKPDALMMLADKPPEIALRSKPLIVSDPLNGLVSDESSSVKSVSADSVRKSVPLRPMS